VDRRIAIRVDAIEPVAVGWFGRTPSIVGNLPDPMRVRGTSLTDRDAGGDISLVLPRAELPAIAPGQRAALGLIAGRTCICIAAIPADVAEPDLPGWLAAWRCGAQK
jgi:hypothetical protein